MIPEAGARIPRYPREMRALSFLCVLSCVAGCADDAGPEDEGAPQPAPPEAAGPYAIGVTTVEVQSGDRTLPVEVWYPARGGGEPAEYVLKVGVLELARLPSPRGARRDAQLDRRGAPYPAVVFSHGNGGTRIQSVYLTEYLVTHGFVVAAPDHVGNTFAEQVNKALAIPPAEAAALRPGDVSRALDALLERSDAPDGTLSGSTDASRLGVAGHSFGGYTTLRVAGATIDTAAVLAECLAGGGLICDGWENVEMPASQADPRFVSALAHAPGGAQAMYGGNRNGFADVSMPVMIQGGTTDAITPWATEQEAPFDSLPAPKSLLGIEKAGHFTFSDMCLLIEELGLTVQEFDDGCGPSNIPFAEAHAIIDRYSTAWFQRTLLGVDVSNVLDPSAPLGPGVASFESK